MFRAPLCPSPGAREYYTSGCCLSYLVLGFKVVGMVWSSPQAGHITLSPTPYRQLENQSTKYDRQQPPVQYSRAPDDGHNGARNMLSKQ